MKVFIDGECIGTAEGYSLQFPNPVDTDLNFGKYCVVNAGPREIELEDFRAVQPSEHSQTTLYRVVYQNPRDGSVIGITPWDETRPENVVFGTIETITGVITDA